MNDLSEEQKKEKKKVHIMNELKIFETNIIYGSWDGRSL